MGYSDPVTLPLLSTGSLNAISVGSEYTRVEKTMRVANIEDSHQALDVCVRADKAGNCSICGKCSRTLITLEICGLIDRYACVFDLRAYRRIRKGYISEIILSNDPLLREIIKFAKDRDYRFPFSSRFWAHTRRWAAAYHVKRLVPERVVRMVKYMLLKAEG